MMPILLSSGFTLNPEMMLGIVTICFTAVELLRTFKKDTKGDASCLATVIAKLESIQSSMNDIKADINTMEKESGDCIQMLYQSIILRLFIISYTSYLCIYYISFCKFL